MATNTVTTEQVREAIEQLAAMVAAASISPQTVADILEMMRNLNDQERLKVIAVAEAYIAQIENTGINAELVNYGAKTVAEALQHLEENILYQETIPHNTFTANDGWETGGYKNDGTFDTSGTLYKTSNKLELDDSGSITMAVAPKLLAFWNGSTWLNRIDNRTTQATTISVPTGATLVAISIDANSAFGISISGLAPTKIPISDKVEEMEETVADLVPLPAEVAALTEACSESIPHTTMESYMVRGAGGYTAQGIWNPDGTAYWSTFLLPIALTATTISFEEKATFLLFFNSNEALVGNRIDAGDTTTFDVPDGAKFFALSYAINEITQRPIRKPASEVIGTSLTGVAPTRRTAMGVVNEIASQVMYKIGSPGYTFFSIQVPIGYSNPSNSVNVEVSPTTTSEDKCCLLLPPDYNVGGKPTPLIIYCHGASWAVTGSSCFMSTGGATIAQYWAAKGFALLEVNGLPEAFHFDWNDGYHMNHYGSPIAIRSYLAAYRYVIDKYNIAQDGVFLIGSSMGGLTCNNLLSNTCIPVKAVLLDGPVISLRNDAWTSGGWGVSPHQYEAMTIALLYHMKNCSIDTTEPDNSTFTVQNGNYAGTYVFKDVAVGGNELMAYFDEQVVNIKGWHPTENKKVLVGNNEYGLIYRAPLKIWHGDQDATNQIAFSEDFVNKVKAVGQYAEMRSIPVSYHTPLRKLDWGSTTDENFTISNEVYEMWLFMRDFL